MEEIDYILLGKILSGEASESDKKEFSNWLNHSMENRHIFERYQHFYNTSEINEIDIHTSENRNRTIPTHNDKYNWKRYIAVAASVLLLLSFTYLLYLNQQSNIAANTNLAENTKVIKSNPKGQKSKIMLPDGSVVWLNSDSNMEYYENFSDSLRVVQLMGEAYFEVVRDSLRPFIVKAGGLQARVLGTAFNISAFKNDLQTSVSLLEGKLLVSNNKNEEFLFPGNQIKYHREDNQLLKSTIEIENIALWKDGILTFNRENFKKVIHELERWYGVTINIEGTPSVNWKFTGYFDNENLKNVLEVLSFGKNLNYELEGKNVTLIVQ